MRSLAERTARRSVIYSVIRRGLAIALLIWSSLASAAQLPLAPIQLVSFKEEFREDVPVWGGIVAGVMCKRQSPTFVPGSVFALIPHGSWRQLKMSIQSGDGRYRAEAVFIIDAPLDGTFEIRYPTVHRERLENFESRDLVVAVWLSESAESKPIAVPACFGPRIPGGVVELVLNSGNTDVQVIAAQPRGGKIVANCRSTLLGDAIAYDVSCALQAAPYSATDLWIVRRHFDLYLPRLELKVFFP